MPRPLSEEHPPLGVSYLYGYDENDISFPVLAVAMDPNGVGYALPALGTTEGLSAEHVSAYPNNKFYRALNITEQRVLWLFEIMPAPWITETKFESDSSSFFTVAKRRNLMASITPSLALTGSGASATAVITEKQQIDSMTGYEVVTSFPLPAAKDESTAIVTEAFLPFQFPATLDATAYTATLGVAGYTREFIRRVSHITNTWFEVSLTKPTITLDGLPIFSHLIGVAGETFMEVIMNSTVVHYEVGDYTYPASSPTLTTYLSSWVNGTARSVLGGAQPTANRYLWKCQKTYVVFLLPAAPTPS